MIPLGQFGKKPYFHDWWERSTTDPLLVRSWFQNKPDANLGIATGRGLLVVDGDPRHGGTQSWTSLTAQRRFPLTATALTGGGGWHNLLFHDPKFVVLSSQSLIGPGLDIIGDHGQIVVEPSVHRSGLEYVWLMMPRQGIAPVPDWLWSLLVKKGQVRLSEDFSKRIGDEQVPIREGIRTGKVDPLLAEMIGKFPVDRVGTRNDQMKRVVASLFGRGYQRDLILDVSSEWWWHFYHLGRIGTNPNKAVAAISATIQSLTTSSSFSPSTSGIDHRSQCQSLRLKPWQSLRLNASIQPTPPPEISPQDPQENPPIIRGSIPIQRLLCETGEERHFVEALVVHCMHKARVEPGPMVRATNDQIAEIVADRYNLDIGHHQTFEILKAKYISRPNDGKFAKRYELLRELVKGKRDWRTGQPGTPSEYERTGIAFLLDPEATL